MTARFDTLTRPKTGDDPRTNSKYLKVGLVLAALGLMVAMVTLIANIAAANNDNPVTAAETLAWSFGLTTFAFGTIKLAISVILIGILVRLWSRVSSVKAALPGLKGHGDAGSPRGDIDTDHGAATETADIPEPLPVHKMARKMWFPMVAMGYMLVVVGTIVSFIWSGKVSDGTQQAAQAWTAGIQFLGEAFLLAGISFLLGSILAALREGGGDVQKSLGLPVRTLKMPVTAKLFVAFMAVGLMVGMLQFVLYIVAAAVTSPQSFAAWAAWLGPVREFSLGLLLTGIVLALVTIGNALSFQFSRIREIVATGK